jgi:hypothetical protein
VTTPDDAIKYRETSTGEIFTEDELRAQLAAEMASLGPDQS